ncbi:MAG: YaeQ family protein [Myxococcales bacterium]
MLHLATTLRVELTINNEPLGVFGIAQRVVLDKRAGESLTHVLLKLLGFALFFHPELQIEASAGQHYKPDLVRFDAQGNPLQWIDCGKISPAKLEKIVAKNRRATFQIIKPGEKEVRTFVQTMAGMIEDRERVLFVGFRAGFLDEFAELLTDRARLIATVIGEHDFLYLDVGGQVLQTPIIKLRPA